MHIMAAILNLNFWCVYNILSQFGAPVKERLHYVLCIKAILKGNNLMLVCVAYRASRKRNKSGCTKNIHNSYFFITSYTIMLAERYV